MGLTAGPVPPRVDAPRQGRPARPGRPRRASAAGRPRRACALLGLDPDRVGRLGGRAERADRLADGPAGRAARVHGLLDGERAAIVALFEAWGEHRPVAPQAGRTAAPGSIWCTSRESTVRRVLAAEGLVLQGPSGPRAGVRGAVAGLGGVETEPHLVLRLHPLHPGPPGRGRGHGRGVPQVAGHPGLGRGDLHPDRGRLHRRAGRRGPARRRIDARLLGRAARGAGHGDREPSTDPTPTGVPVLLAMSRQRPADALAHHPGVHGRRARSCSASAGPAPPPTRPGSSPCSGTSRATGRTWRRSATPASSTLELDRVRIEYNTVRLHAGIGYVTPDDEHHGRGDAHPPGPPRRAHPSTPAPDRLPSNHNRRTHHDRAPTLAGYFQPICLKDSDTPSRDVGALAPRTSMRRRPPGGVTR